MVKMIHIVTVYFPKAAMMEINEFVNLAIPKNVGLHTRPFRVFKSKTEAESKLVTIRPPIVGGIIGKKKEIIL